MSDYYVNINGQGYSVNAEQDTPLLWVLRDHVGLKGTKFGCGIGACGACTIHLNGTAIRSCMLKISAVPKDARVTTIEGIGASPLHPVQHVWIEQQVPQCGYCQSGQIMSAVALVEKNSRPTDAQIDSAMAGNICRCGTYDRIRKAIHRAAEIVRQKQ